MLLAIDVGNTNTVFALHDGAAVVAEWRCSTDRQRTADEYFVWLRQLFDHHALDPVVRSVVISSVVPQVVFNLRVLSDRYFHTRPKVVGKPEVKLGVPVRVDPTTHVGADRLVNTVGAYDRYGGDLIVVDFGTATTFDVVGHDGAYEGGIIAPGVNLSLKALHDAAAALPFIDVTKPDHVVGTNTVACMQSGIYWGYVGLIEGLCARIRAERGIPMTVIGTGGLSTLFAQGTDVLEKIDTGLTIHGLVLIDRLNEE
ncbi:MAG: type III pantothenate kinase [Rhodovulum sulfidophilum]|uniref:Type III pantothenate kinase n=1 Tax=Rhodovulum sulfidophilum TaxID=35806 RepID=A0A2W5PUW8_RHOSU|nr:MAG: type III pantothenate kinase [Rhodovulum sulfidophilum]